MLVLHPPSCVTSALHHGSKYSRVFLNALIERLELSFVNMKYMKKGKNENFRCA